MCSKNDKDEGRPEVKVAEFLKYQSKNKHISMKFTEICLYSCYCCSNQYIFDRRHAVSSVKQLILHIILANSKPFLYHHFQHQKKCFPPKNFSSLVKK